MMGENTGGRGGMKQQAWSQIPLVARWAVLGMLMCLASVFSARLWAPCRNTAWSVLQGPTWGLTHRCSITVFALPGLFCLHTFAQVVPSAVIHTPFSTWKTQDTVRLHVLPTQKPPGHSRSSVAPSLEPILPSWISFSLCSAVSTTRL